MSPSGLPLVAVGEPGDRLDHRAALLLGDQVRIATFGGHDSIDEGVRVYRGATKDRLLIVRREAVPELDAEFFQRQLCS